MIRRQQIVAARALLSWSREDLPTRSGVSKRTIARFEAGEGDITSQKLAKLEECLMAVGIGFVEGGVTLESLKPRRPGGLGRAG